MAEIRFSCQACHQHINCDEAWAGHQIQCPVCSKTITVPSKVTATATGGGASAAAASPPHGTLVPKVPEKANLALSQNAQQPAPAAQKHIPIRNLAAPPPKKEGPWKTIGILAAVLTILGASAYFGWPYVSKMLNKEEPQASAPASPKQEATHAAPSAPLAEMAPPVSMAPPGEASPTPAVTNVAQTGPVIPAVHTLEIASARTPSGRVNGKVSGAAFLPDVIRIDPVGPSQVLRFCEGDLMSPERELLIYLKLKPGEKLEGQKISISEDMRGKGTLQVTKRWKTNAKYAPATRSFSSGYVLKLELSDQSNGTVKGRVYLSLPDNELTVAAGNFTAVTTIPDGGVASPTAVPAPGANPAQPQPMPGFGGQRGVPNDFQRRYGVQ
jgi:hypothetical protein